MSLRGKKSEKLTSLDYVFTVLSNANTSLDFGLILHLTKPLNIDSLQDGGRSARNKYPITSSFVYRGSWEHAPALNSEMEQLSTDDEQTTIEKFLDRPF